MSNDLTVWLGFNLLVAVMLALDLGVFHRKAHSVSLKEAGAWSVIWVALSLAFNAVVYYTRGSEAGAQFLTGYLIEKSLSVDNIFIFVLIFGYFRVPSQYQHRVLFFGILGALVMRAALIFLGAALIERFSWIIYIFGAFLIYTGWKMAVRRDEHPDPEKNPVLRLAKRFLPVHPEYDGQRFFVRRAGKLLVTPLFLVLLVVESTDLIFAVDSIPAIFGVTQDPFIVYTSNVFAILGLRAMYFLLAGVVHRFRYLNMGLAFILVFVGAKMVLSDWFHLPVALSLGVVIGILAIALVASLLAERREEKEKLILQAAAEAERAVPASGEVER